MAIDFSKYTNPFLPTASVDLNPFISLLRDQFSRKQQNDQVAHQNRVAEDINTRFAIDQGEKTTGRQFAYAQDNKAKTDKLLMAARTAISQGNWNAADSLIGPLAELGVKTDRQVDAQGRPVYRFEAPEFAGPTGETYESAAGKLRVPGVTAPQQVNQISPDATQQDRIEQPQTTPQAPTTRSEVQAQTTPDQNGDTPQQSPFDPFKLDSSEFARINAMRLNPVLRGIESGFPNRFQPLVGSYLESLKSLNMTPEQTLEVGQKPLDTMSRLYGAELSAEGNMARASIGASGGASSEARLRENESFNRTERQAKDIGLHDALMKKQQFNSIRERISSGNPNAVADAVKELIGLREGGRITDQDFSIGLSGVASKVEEFSNVLQRLYMTGLNENQTRNFQRMIDMIQSKNDQVIKLGAKRIQDVANNQRFEADTLGVRAWIDRYIPPELRTEESKRFKATERQPGLPVRTQPNSSVRASVAVPVPPQNTDEEEAQKLLEEMGQ